MRRQDARAGDLAEGRGDSRIATVARGPTVVLQLDRPAGRGSRPRRQAGGDGDKGPGQSSDRYSIRPFEAIVGDGLGYASGNILGIIYAYGLFESDNALDAYTGIVPLPLPLDDTLEQLADLIDAHIDIAWLARCLGLPALLQRST
jgi:hypothetical protein